MTDGRKHPCCGQPPLTMPGGAGRPLQGNGIFADHIAVFPDAPRSATALRWAGLADHARKCAVRKTARRHTQLMQVENTQTLGRLTTVNSPFQGVRMCQPARDSNGGKSTLSKSTGKTSGGKTSEKTSQNLAALGGSQNEGEKKTTPKCND